MSDFSIIPGTNIPAIKNVEQPVPFDPSAPFPSEDEIRKALVPVEDPELNLSVVELGLIYGIEANEKEREVTVTMTLTSIACPIGPQLRAAVHGAVAKFPGVEDVYVQLVFNPPWDPRTMASEDAQLALGIG